MGCFNVVSEREIGGVGLVWVSMEVEVESSESSPGGVDRAEDEAEERGISSFVAFRGLE